MKNRTNHTTVEAVHTEIWKKLKEYPNYEVSNLGRIRNQQKLLKPYKTNNGYLHIFLSKNGKQKQFLLHRLIAEAFIDNLKNLKEINHIDGDKSNNSINNLEWCTRKSNVHHFLCSNTRNTTMARPVTQYDLKGNKVKTFKSIRQASKESKIDAHYIIYCCKGNKAKTSNYMWKYEVA